MPESAVARIKKQIEHEVAAAHRALYGYAVVSRHDIINRHLDKLGTHLKELSQEVGTEAALMTVMTALEEQS